MERVSIVIPARNEEKFLPECLASLQEQTYPHDCMEIILVNSASEDGTAAIMEDFAHQTDIPVRILENPRGDTPNALNIGIKNATGDFVMFMTAHGYLKPDHIQKALQTLHEKGADAVGGRIVTIGSGEGTIWDNGIATAMESAFGLGNSTARVNSKPGWIDNPMLALYRSDVFQKFGYIDERLRRNQDYEFNQRCFAGGAKFWFEPDLKVFYHNRANLRQLWRQYFNAAKWRTFMIGEHVRAVRPRHLVPPVFVLTLLLSAIAAIFWKPAALIFIAVAALYAIGIAMNTIWQLFSRKKPSLLIALPLSFITIHFAFGIGFIVGFLQFIFLARRKKILAAEKQRH